MTEISVATWNLHQAVDKRAENIGATWRYLEREVRPTIALVQEATVIPETPGGQVASRADDVGYATAVVGYGARLERLPEVTTRYSRRHAFVISPRVPATFAVAQVVDLPDDVEPFVAISLYGRMAPLYAQTGVLRAVADLIPLFDAPAFNRRIVLGGDLNVYDQTSDKVMRGRWKAILAIVESLGLVNLLKVTQPDRGPRPGCPCREPSCWHVETFHHRNAPAGREGYFTTDYLFASRDLADRLIRPLEVWGGTRPEVWELSDHCPLVARFGL
jgi:endonuclease/exonuclease/phosphatase family metal-dependent hydrolase